MKKSFLTLAVLLALVAATISLAPRTPFDPGHPGPDESPEAVIKTWPPRARAAAAAMLEKYGRPNQFDRRTLVWFNNGNWKRTIVYRDGCPARKGAGARRKENLEQAVGYLVPRIRAEEMTTFNSMLEASESAGELSFCSRSEADNILAINLADEIATGRRTAKEGRDIFKKTLRLEASGKTSPYRSGLNFEVDNTRHVVPGGAQ